VKFERLQADDSTLPGGAAVCAGIARVQASSWWRTIKPSWVAKSAKSLRVSVTSATPTRIQHAATLDDRPTVTVLTHDSPVDRRRLFSRVTIVSPRPDTVPS
jgi:hypothetical protein